MTIITVVVISSISIIFSITGITTIKPTYANHTATHLNNSLVDITISSDDDIPVALLEDIKRNIARQMKIDEQKAFEKNNNNSQFQIDSLSSSTKGKIILTSHKYSETPDDESYDELSGQVKNIGNGTAEDVSLIFTYYDMSGNALGNDNTRLYADILHPGQKSSFMTWREVSKTSDMAYYDISLSWYNSDGTQEYVENVNVTEDLEETPIIEKISEQENNNEKGNTISSFFGGDGNDGREKLNEDGAEESDKDSDENDEDDEDEDEDGNDEDDDEDEDDENN